MYPFSRTHADRASIERPAPSPRSVVEVARERLRGSPYVAVRALSCELQDGSLIVSGQVPTFYSRQVALALVCAVDGVEAIVDRIEVVALAPATRRSLDDKQAMRSLLQQGS